MNAEKNNMNRVVPPVGGGSSKNWADLNPYLLYFMYLELNYFDFEVFSEKNSPGRTGIYKKNNLEI